MGNLNYIGGIVKILEIPSSSQLSSNGLVLRFRAQLAVCHETYYHPTITLIVWGDLKHKILGSYKVNDYILIEGHLLIQPLKFQHFFEKQVQINITKIFHFSFKNKD